MDFIGDLQIKLSTALQPQRSMSPIRGDVKDKVSPLSPDRGGRVVSCIQPDLRLEKFFVACTPDKP
jgi:hypothetical protein